MIFKNWDTKKFIKGMVELFDGELWGKDISSLVNLRKIIIYAIIVALFAGYWYWKGMQNTNAVIDIGYKDEITMKAPENYQYMDDLAVHKDKDSNNWGWVNYNTKEQYAKVLLRDVPQSAKLRPYGFENKVIGFYGVGSGEAYTGVEAGVGFRFARLWDFRTEIIGTNKGGYLSVSYKVKKFVFENTYLNVGVGKGFKGDGRAIVGLNVEF